MKKRFLLIFFLIFSVNANLDAKKSSFINSITNINTPDENGNTPLHIALKENNIDAAEKLLSNNNINVNLQDSNGNTALHLAIEKSANNLIPLLIKRGADINIKNEIFISPTLLAACYGKKEILELLLKDKDVLLGDFLKTIKFNDIKAFCLLLESSKNDPFAERDKRENIIYNSIVAGNKDFIDICTENTDSINNYIFGYAPLHLAVMYGHYDLVRYFVENCAANINAFDYDGLAPLHYAVMYGNYEITNYLINKKCSINEKTLKDKNFCKKGHTCLDFAIQFGHTDIINLLVSKKAIANNIQEKNIISDPSNYLTIFIDSGTEQPKSDQPLMSINTAFSEELVDIIRQEACPVIIIGQHLLKNALQLSCSLKNWLIVEIVDTNTRGYLIIPKYFISNLEYFSVKTLDLQLQNLGFDFSLIDHNYIDESQIINEKTYTFSTKKYFNKSTVPILNNILLPRKRFIYWGGHGRTTPNPSIGGLSNKYASKFLDILSNKSTKIVCISSCFFGGKNYKAIEDFDDMVIISSATTEISSSRTAETKPNNWRNFFNMLSKYQDYNSSNYCEYLSNYVFPFITTHSPNISNFPHIKIPRQPFKLLNIGNKSLLINTEIISNASTNLPLLIDNKKLLEIDIEQIKKPLKIKTEIPLIISNKRKNIFEKISIENIKNNIDKDFIDIVKKLTMPDSFKKSTLENTFLIKELTLSTEFRINIVNKNMLIKRLYNVFICRGASDKCKIFLSTNKNTSINNSILVTYDDQINQWEAYTNLTKEDFNQYQQFLIQNY